MRLAKTILLALPLVLLLTALVSAQETEREKRRITNPTVTGGTGLFTVYDSSTLKKGEFNLGIFVNNYDRDPGDVDILQTPINFAIGATDHLEFFVNDDAYQRLMSDSPFELSGPLFLNLTHPALAFDFTPIRGGLNNDHPPFYPLNGAPIGGALVGGILPGLPQTGGQIIFDPILNAFKPAFFVPGYLNDFPFLGKGGGTTGNVTVGAKYRLNSQDAKIGYAVVGLIRIPTVLSNSLLTKNRGGRLALGSGAGTPDYGGFFVISPRFGIVSTHINVGYMHSGDPERSDNELIDRNDSVIFSGGIDVPFSQYAQAIGEVTYNLYVGSQTPNLNQVNPVDVVVGARFYPFGKQENRRFLFSLGGGYRYNINNSGEEREASRRLLGGRSDSDYNGFVAHVTFGLRRVAPKPVPPPPNPCETNRPPTVTLTADKMAVKQGANETVVFTARGMDADNDNLIYKWTASGGTLTGTGGQMTWSSAGLGAGDYRISVTVTDVCTNTATDSRTVTVEKVNNCPTVTLRANPTSVQEGSDQPFTFSANGNDPDGDRLQYTWTSTRGTLSGGDTEKRLDTTGLAAGSITVKVTITDGQCPATDSVTVNITPRPVPPPVFSTSCSTYKTANDTRPDNACKRVLDDVAARLQADPTATVILDGHSDKGEKPGTAKRRAERVRDYLVNERRVDANRVEIRSFDATRPHESGDRNLNRRVVIHVVPQGAVRPQ